MLHTALFLLALSHGAQAPATPLEEDHPARGNVVWDSPSESSAGSMPLGNGETGINLWVERGGDLCFYVSRTDAWNENCHLLKLGRVRIGLDPNPFVEGARFRQELRLREGEVVIRAGEEETATEISVRVDANHPLVLVETRSETPTTMRVALECWRREARELTGEEAHTAYGLHGRTPPYPVITHPDTILEDRGDRVVWYHRNEKSIWGVTLGLQALGELVERGDDPLLHRTFGGCLLGEGLVRVDDTTLVSSEARTAHRVRVVTLGARTDTAEDWLGRLDRRVEALAALDLERARVEHIAWWNAFWNRSWIDVRGDAAAEAVTRGYALQRWINACAGRGTFPIKFNGSLFTVDAKAQGYDADYRRWGGPYWWQNTRLPYWSMIAAGDLDLMEPLFRMYVECLPLARERTRRYYGHAGAFFPETMYFWGTYTNANYGWDREGMADGLTTNGYIRREWQGGIELVEMMLDVHAHTMDRAFLAKTLLPLATEVTAFFDEHWPRTEGGEIRMNPSQALETWWETTNPMPEIAGLRRILPRLLALPEEHTRAEDRAMWRDMLEDLPAVPTGERGGEKVLLPAEEYDVKRNREHPELYAVFPYPLYGTSRPDLELALATWRHREHQDTGGWNQNAIQAAMLGLADEAGDLVARNFSTSHAGSRFPAFWGPNFDWIPDQDHGGVSMIALQRMLLQVDGSRLLILPAWPRRWDVDFRLHAPGGRIVEATVRGGKLEHLEITPPPRAEDVVVLFPRR